MAARSNMFWLSDKTEIKVLRLWRREEFLAFAWN
jgi:hypothetical protein